jgi:hypothetical protein
MGALIPVGVWIRTTLPDGRDAAATEFIGFTYVDPQAGLSAKGGARGEPFVEAPTMTLRLPLGDLPWERLGDEEIATLALPRAPSWVEEFYGPQPPPGTPWGAWREHPALVGKFHPEHPDDVQVIVHDGGPRLSDRRPELVWARVTGMDGELFQATVLNRPHALVTVAHGQAIQFVVPAGLEHGLLVTPKYVAERGAWQIEPCKKCGLGELLDAPSDLLRVVFPSTPPGAQFEAFSSFCGLCGGVQMVTRRGSAITEQPPATEQPAATAACKWWQFWKRS